VYLRPCSTNLQKRALATREAHLASLDLKKFVDEATQTTHAAELEAVSLAIRPRQGRRQSRDVAGCNRTSAIAELRGGIIAGA